MAYTVAEYAEDLRRITKTTTNEDDLFRHVGPLAQKLANDRS